MTAYKKEYPEDITDRGAIDFEGLQLLFEHIREKYGTEPWAATMMCALGFQWAFGLRGGQLRSLRRDQFFQLLDGSWLYTGPRHKSRTGTDGETQQETHTMAPETRRLVEFYLGKKAMNELLFPHHPERRASEIIREAAIRYGWDSTLKWGGSHCLRHGSIMTAMQQGGLEAAMARSAHRTEKTSRHYARPNEARRHGHPPGSKNKRAQRTKKAKKEKRK
jgi:integrase